MLFTKRERERTIRRILIVEDEPLIAFENEHLLSDAGYEVVATVDNAADATRVISEAEMDLVMTDVHLSGEGDGSDVARAAAAKGVPVLFVTGNCPEEARALAFGCLAKPYSEKMLKGAIAAIEAQLAGRPLKKLPAGFTLFEVN